MKYISLLILIFISANTKGQEKANIGILSGGSYYLGDINTSKQFYKIRPLYGAIYRYNINKRYAIRSSFFKGRFAADDNDSKYKYQKDRNISFVTNIYDFTIQCEFNFFPYITTDVKKNKWTPYVLAGFTAFQAKEFDLAIPIGVGVKYNYNKRIGIGIEWVFKRAFHDDLDFADTFKSNKQISYVKNKDWYSLVGLFITYKFDTAIDCHAYD